MKHKQHSGVIAAAVLVVAGVCGAHAEPATQAQPAPQFRYGAAERLRQEYFDHVPVKADPPGVARGGENDYFRIRTSLWSEFDASRNVTFRVRAVNEMRAWLYPDVTERPQRSTSEWPDEVVFDHAYADIHGLFRDTLDLRVGRQDLIYGTGKVLLEGTPGDGSRTLYFNAIKATYRGVAKNTIDVLGIYNEAEDELAINAADRDLSGVPRAREGVTESGGGIYLKNQAVERLPFEAYALFKQEGEYDSAAKTNAAGFVQPAVAWQTVNAQDKVVENGEADIGTLGVRLMPKVSDTLSGNVELACQFGERGDASILGYMADAFVVQKLGVLPELKPAVDAGVYFLSGDDPATQDDESWDPLWARYPQFSELYVYALDNEDLGARWSNLLMPHAGLTLNPLAWMKTTAAVSYLYAPENDGPGGGHERGWLGTLKNEFTLTENWLRTKDKLTAHLWLEVLEPGDYYKVDDTSVFARWEVNYLF
jgi:hypothetical protein